MEGKPASESRSQLVRWMGVLDANTAGNVHGGTIMKLCDEVAGLAAIKHSRRRVVTAAMDRMAFLVPIRIGELVTLSATVNAAWRTSMEVGVRVEAENPLTGEARHTNTAYRPWSPSTTTVTPRPYPRSPPQRPRSSAECTKPSCAAPTGWPNASRSWPTGEPDPSGRAVAVESGTVTLVVITGATRGIGRAAAVELARRGCEVAVVGREAARVGETAAEAKAAGGGAPIHEHVVDLTSMAEVRRLAEELRGRYEHIDVLANNAGALFASRRVTPEGFELSIALNHLAPFLLTNLLRDRLTGSRVVTTASDAHQQGRLNLDDLQSEHGYAAMRVYGTTKLCNILFTRELARRAPELHANCFHPGVVRTGFGKNDNGIWKVLTTLGSPFFRSPERGARSLVWLALSDEAAELTGAYVEDEKVVAPSAQAQDDTLARELWVRSAELVGLPAESLA